MRFTFWLLIVTSAWQSDRAHGFLRFGGWSREVDHRIELPVDLPTAHIGEEYSLSAEIPTEVTSAGTALLTEYRDRQSFSECWRQAVGSLDETCGKALANQRVRSRLALDFTNCQLSGDGKQSLTVDCPTSYDIQSCIGRMDEKIYPVYLQFRLHVDTLCFHVQQELFQRRAAASAAALRNAASDASRKMVEMNHQAEKHAVAMEELAIRQQSMSKHTEVAVDRLATLAKAHDALSNDLRSKEFSLQTISATVETISERQEAMATGLRKAADDADELARRQVDAIHRIGLSADGIKQGVAETTAATNALLQDQKELAMRLSNVGVVVKEVHEAQDVALDKAHSVSSRLESLAGIAESSFEQQFRFLDTLRSETQAVSQLATAQQRDVMSTSTHILTTLAQLHETISYISEVALSVESLMYYSGMAIAVILLSTARNLAEARFPGLMLGPVACFAVEKWLLREAVVLLYWFGLSTDPWVNMVGGTDFKTAVSHVHLRTVRQCFAFVVVAVFLRAATQYESPEMVQNRVVQRAVREAMADAFADGGVATKYFVSRAGLLPRRTLSEPAADRESIT